MKRLVLMATLKMCGKAIVLTVMVSIAIGAIGYVRAWDTSLAYSNAFFIAGCLVIVAGASSRLAAGREWASFQALPAESFRHMNRGEMANVIINVSSSLSLVLLGFLTGILLILISVFVTEVF
ncbi:MAG: hypothetical protein PVI09_23635 [Anaerolineae bacterium]